MTSQGEADMDVSVNEIKRIARDDVERSHMDDGKAGLLESGGHDAGIGSGSGTRLLITKMVLENFKSYGGTREIGPFHKCFSSIVGPNGSGKSNVIDAMLFVFGRKAKKLRQAKVSELIHRSEAYANLQHTSVSVHFVDIVDEASSEDAYQEVPGTGLVVTRTAFKDNTSRYKIDGKNSTFKEVGALLRKRGVDLDNNRFLILQGEVEQIAMMKPKAQTPTDEGLLEYLEDIIGSNRYVRDAEEAAQEVELLGDQRLEKLNRLKLVEKEKDSLQGAREEAEECLRLEARVRAKMNLLYQTHIVTADENTQKVSEKAGLLQEKLEKEQGKLRDTQVKVMETAVKHKAMSAEHAAVRSTMEKVKEEFAEYERQDIKRSERAKSLKEQRKKLEAAIKRETKKAEESLKHADDLEAGMGALGSAVKQAESRKALEEAALEQVNESLKGETASLREKLEKAQEKAAPVREEAEALRNKVETHECKIRLVKEAAEGSKRRLRDARSKSEEILRLAEVDREALASARAESQAIGGEIEEALQAAKEAGSRVEAMAQAVAKAVSAAEEGKSSREAAAGRSGALKALLEAADPGGRLAGAGICGRLGDLGIIPAEHDVAVSTACNMLDHVVVETVAGGQRCVEHLRTNNLGRASFIILEQLGHLEAGLSRPFRASPQCPRLFDLIQVSERRFLPAFYLGLRDTLVAPDLDTASANAYRDGRCVARVVSSDGSLIERSGAMSGGGRSVKRGGMRTSGAAGTAPAGMTPGLVTEGEVRRLAEAAAAAEESARAAREDKKGAEGRVQGLRARERELQTLTPKLAVRLGGVDATLEQYNQQIRELEGQCELSPEEAARLQELEAMLAVDQKKLAKVSKVLDKMQDSIESLQGSILEVGGERLKKTIKRADAAARALDEAVQAVSRAEVGSRGERQKGQKALAGADRKRKELEGVNAEAEEMEEAFKSLEESAFKVHEEFEKVQKDLEAKTEELGVITQEHEKARALEDTIRGVEVDITTKLEDYTKIILDNKKMAKDWRDKRARLCKDHLRQAKEWGVVFNVEGDDIVEDGHKEGGDCSGDSTDGSNCEEEGGGIDEGKGERRNRGREGRRGRRVSGDEGSEELQAKGLPDFDPEVLEDVDREKLKLKIAELEGVKKRKEGSVNMNALGNFRRKEKEYLKWVSELEVATAARNAARGLHEELRRKRLEEFMAGFGKITLRLKEMYQMITLGGDAELELVDSLDPFSEGIVFSVRPPKKSWKNIANLSGGEKTLSSLALVFALHHFKPTPLYVMDEIDAALDFKNVSIVANYIKERTRNAQFIIISLRNNMFELANRLVGIYKTHDITKSVTIDPATFATGQDSKGANKHQQEQSSAGPSSVLGDSTNTLPAEA